VDHASSVIHRGLSRSYQEIEDSLPSLRGRLLVSRELRRVVHDRIDCRFADLSFETPENLLLKSSLHSLQNRHREIPALLARMSMVPLAGVPRGPWPRIRYTQLNRHYKRSLDLSRLAIKGPPRYILLERKPR